MNRSYQRPVALLAISLGLAGALLLGGCATKPPKTDTSAPITEVSLEAPTAPTSASPAGASPQREAELVALRAENQALSNELTRIQSANRAWAMETARLREEVIAKPMPTASAPERSSPVSVTIPRTGGGGGASAGGSPESGTSVPTGVYTVQTASYAQTDGGRRAADKLCEFFQKQGFSPASYRESGKFLIVLVGAYGSKSEADSARSQIASLEYYGRKGDFKSSTVRKN